MVFIYQSGKDKYIFLLGCWDSIFFAQKFVNEL
jgi:hypothetical protein